jgi:drug/metabolite transporter (DMT)-like permease
MDTAPAAQRIRSALSGLVFLIWLANIVVDTAGHSAFKLAAGVDAEDELARWKAMLLNWPIWVGIVCFIGEFILWLALVSLIPLSMSVLMAAMNMAAIVVAGRIFFGEKLDPLRLAGLFCIMVGVALVGGGA